MTSLFRSAFSASRPASDVQRQRSAYRRASNVRRPTPNETPIAAAGRGTLDGPRPTCLRATHRQTPNGFTLLEMMVVLGVFSIVLAAIYLTLSSGRRSWHEGEAAVEVQEDVRKGLRWVGQELRESGRDTTPRVLINSPTNNILVFQIPVDANTGTPEFDLDSNSDIVWGALDDAGAPQAGNAVRYDLQGTQLIRAVVGSLNLAAPPVGIQKVVANNITSVSFTPVPATGNITGVDITLNAQKTSLEQHLMQSSQRLHVVLRNVFD